jgi:hypothetical protein
MKDTFAAAGLEFGRLIDAYGMAWTRSTDAYLPTTCVYQCLLFLKPHIRPKCFETLIAEPMKHVKALR